MPERGRDLTPFKKSLRVRRRLLAHEKKRIKIPMGGHCFEARSLFSRQPRLSQRHEKKWIKIRIAGHSLYSTCCQPRLIRELILVRKPIRTLAGVGFVVPERNQ